MANIGPLKKLFYQPPSILQDPVQAYIEHSYNPIVVQESLQDVINRFVIEGGREGREAYVWSLYDTLGIPEGSLIYDESMTELVRDWTRVDGGIHMEDLFTSAWFSGTPFMFMSDQRANILQIQTPQGIRGRRHELHVEDNGMILNSKDLYKLHVSVNHKYILYTILKLNTLRFTWAGTGKRPFQLKCLFNSRYSEVTAENSIAFDIRGNAGSVPPIVVYCSQYPQDLRLLFHKMNTLFSDEDRNGMGLMSLGDPTRIPPMNVRLNKMFAYALGDRNEKLTALEGNIDSQRDPVCRLPAWLLASMGECSRNPAITDTLQEFFGRPVCDRVVDGTFHTRLSDGSIDHLCYLSLSAQDMIAPSQVLAPFHGGKTFRTHSKKRRKTKRSKHLRRNIRSLSY